MEKYKIIFSDGSEKTIDAEQFVISDGCALFAGGNKVFAAYKNFVSVELQINEAAVVPFNVQ